MNNVEKNYIYLEKWAKYHKSLNVLYNEGKG